MHRKLSAITREDIAKTNEIFMNMNKDEVESAIGLIHLSYDEINRTSEKIVREHPELKDKEDRTILDRIKLYFYRGNTFR